MEHENSAINIVLNFVAIFLNLSVTPNSPSKFKTDKQYFDHFLNDISFKLIITPIILIVIN